MILVALAACAVSNPTLWPDDDVPMLVFASWGGTTSARTRVEVDDEAGPVLTTDWQDAGGDHRVPLLGLAPDHEFTARVVSEAGESSDDVDFATGTVPAELPGWSVSGTPGWEGYLLTGIVSEPSWAVVLDQDGRVVWAKKAHDGKRVLRVRVRPDGEGLRYSEIEEAELTETSQLVTVDWDGTEVSRHTVPAFNHDFVDADDGGADCLVTDVRPGQSGAEVIGDAIHHVSDDGAITPLWSTWDAWEVPPDDEIEGGRQWTHANALDRRDGGGYWLGLRNSSELVELDADLAVGRRIGGPESTYTFATQADRPKWQHQFQFLDGGVILFDDRDEDPSRVLELTLDETTATATAAWTWTHPKNLEVYILGDVDRAADGSTLAVFSTSGVIDDIAPDGELRWELSLDLGSIVPYVVRLDALPGVSRGR